MARDLPINSRIVEQVAKATVKNIIDGLAWIIHGPRLLQMQGTAHETVRMYRKWAVTQQMR